MTFENDRRFAIRLKTAYWLAVISLLPVAFTSFIWLEVIRGIPSRAIDGSGHYAIAQIYDQSIFPDTFGWTNAYFAGMPFPNFYPPLFFWTVSLLHHSYIFSFATAFKLVVSVPLILMPLVSWAIAWFHAGKDHNVALGAVAASATLYTLGEIFQPNTGLDMSSTLLDGFYTQPLGFVLLLLWILVYLFPQQKRWRFVASATLLALTVLANFFNAITAIIFIASVLLFDLANWFRANDPTARRNLRNTVLLHFASPWLALALTAFWIFPMVSSYRYLVTRPLIKPLSELITLPILCWYILAGIGAGIWLRHRSGRIVPYLIACLILLITLLFAGSLAPAWFPLQVFRFFSTMNALLCLPIGISIAYAINLYLGKKQRVQRDLSTHKIAIVIAITVIALLSLAAAMSRKKLTQASAFYTPETLLNIAGPLEFGRTHKDGRYLVEVISPRVNKGPVRADSLALNAYLGAQGNQTVSIVYREASPSSSFFNAELNALSSYRENFGISSVLMDDTDFIDQPLPQHLKRLQFIGVRYVVIASPELKARLASEPGFETKHEIGPWTIFELPSSAEPHIRSLPYRPALLVSDFTVKLRRQDQLDFVRLAEEQFSDAWFDVLLVRSAESKIDRLSDLQNFGALVLANYDSEDENHAFLRLKEFAQTRPLILISGEASLFQRIQSSLSEFPKAVVIQRIAENRNDWVEGVEPSHSYNASSIRSLWKSVRQALEQEKTPIAENVQAQMDQTAIHVTPAAGVPGKNIPVLIAQTYNPKWVRRDQAQVYPATPFFSVTFIDRDTLMVFERDRIDRFSIWISLIALVAVVLVAAISLVKRLRPVRA